MMASVTPGIDEESAPKREDAQRRNCVISSCLECGRRKMKCDRAVREPRDPSLEMSNGLHWRAARLELEGHAFYTIHEMTII